MRENLEKKLDDYGLNTDEKDAIKYLGNIKNNFSTLGEGTETTRRSQLVMQSLEVLYRRLDKPSQLKLVYFEMGGVSQLPKKAANTLEEYVDGKINLDQAQKELKTTMKTYSDAFTKLGIKPTNISHLFHEV